MKPIPCECPECGAPSEQLNGEKLLCLDCTDYKMGQPDGSDYEYPHQPQRN